MNNNNNDIQDIEDIFLAFNKALNFNYNMRIQRARRYNNGELAALEQEIDMLHTLIVEQISYLQEQNTPIKIICGWTQETVKNIEYFAKLYNDSSENVDDTAKNLKNIKTEIAYAPKFCAKYKKFYLPIQEKIMLSAAIEKSNGPEEQKNPVFKL